MEIMLKNFLLLPFIYITTLFLEVFTYKKKSKLRIILNNLIYGLLLSIIYGLSISIFITPIFINNVDSIGAVMLSTIIFIFIINLALISKYRDENLILPNQYIIIISLIALILTKKYIIKSIIKLFGLTILLSFFLLNIITVLEGNLDNPNVTIIGIIIMFLLAITILYRVKVNSFEQAVNRFFLTFNLGVIVFIIGSLRLSGYMEFTSSTNWLDIMLIIFSIVGFLFIFLPHAAEVYDKYNCEFNQAYHLFWDELVKISGYNDVKRDIKLEVSDLLDGLNSLKKEWEEGNKKVIIKRSIISLSLVVILFTFLYLLLRYGDNLRELSQLYTGYLYVQWSSLFKDESKAQLTLVLGIMIILFIYFLYSLFIAIKNNHLVSNILLHINRLIFTVIILVVLTTNLFRMALSPITSTILVVLFITLMLLVKIQDWFKKKGK
ncbi:hypothetical protein HF072_18270 [Bacillus sp. RO3]|nr:hypothetical protein [Bacillus sp. RO3]